MEPRPLPLTRRRFLQAVGAVGGAAAVLGSMEALRLVAPAAEHTTAFRPPRSSDFALQGRVNGTNVLVIGGGIAGLTAAYELEKAGYVCEILEARDRPGGRNWTVRGGAKATDVAGVTQRAAFSDGLYMNAGPARIPQHHTTIDYCRELGVPIEVFANANADGWYYNESGNGVFGPLADRRIRHRAARADYFGYVSELLAKAVSQGALDAELRPEDAERMVEFLRGFGALGPGMRYEGGPSRGFANPPRAGLERGTLEDPPALPDLLASQLGFYFPFEDSWDQAMLMFQPVGGMDRIPHALAGAIRGRIRYGTEVRAITVRDAGVEVVAFDGRESRAITADFCVCTLPPPVLAKVPTNLPTSVQVDIASLRMLPVAKMGLEFKRRFWEEDDGIFGGITDTNMDISTIWYPSSGYLGERGLVIGYYNFAGNAEAYGVLSPENRERRALEQGRKVHGEPYLTEFASSFSQHWERDPYSLGGWVEWQDREAPAGSATYGRLLEPQGRLYFAGDHLSQVTAGQHGAFESARAVVTQLHQRVLAG